MPQSLVSVSHCFLSHCAAAINASGLVFPGTYQRNSARLIAATSGETDAGFHQWSTDSRAMCAGQLFVALVGDRFDGHDFCAAAVAAGAVALVVERPLPACAVPQLCVDNTTLALAQIAACQRERFSGALVAITGSCGKTTVKSLLATVLALMGPTKATQGNFNNHIGVPLTLNQLDENTAFAVVEMGASGLGEIAYLTRVAKPQVAIVTTVQPAHLEGFGSLDAIACEKQSIYDGLSPDGTAVINLDLPYSQAMLDYTQGVKRVGFSLSEQGSLAFPYLYSRNAQANAQGAYGFDLCYQAPGKVLESVPVRLQMLGAHQVANALAVAAAARALGASWELIAEGLSQASGEKGRMQWVAPWFENQQARVINDAYNANPASVRSAIAFLAEQPEPRVLVLGTLAELGDEAEALHRDLGHFAREAGITQLIAVGDLPGHAAQAFGAAAVHCATLEAAVDEVAAWLSQPATLVLKGSRSAGVDRLLTLLQAVYPESIHP